MTVEQILTSIKKWLKKLECDGCQGGTSTHNLLEGLQGGQEGEYYHLSEEQYQCVVSNCDNSEIGSWVEIPEP